MLDKKFNFEDAEARIYARWEGEGAFKPSNAPGAEPYTIVIPPPNVTGSLHMGHALNDTLQDILCRFERMRGRSVLWQPGMDHAGIATQMVVERQMMERQEKRTDLTREEFIERVWQWKEESGGTILNQLKRLGASCDWSRERFTMGDPHDPDDQMVKAVIKVFVALHKDGLIYRDKRLVNWDPKFETAISDLEVENREVDGHFWHFKYPLENGETYEFPIAHDEDGNPTAWEMRDYISIATTRPETMLGDGAVAVHPSDKRYAPIVGKLCEIPVGPKEHRRLIPIITDDYPDPDFGSGAVKITGAHDFNDYQVAKRCDIPMYRLMDWRGGMREDGAPYAEEAAKAKQLVEEGGAPDAVYVETINLVPDEYRGLDRFEARKAVVADIDADGLMIAVEDKKIMQPFGDRSGVVIEPMLTDQWYVDAKTLAGPAIEAVESGKTKFVPENWAKTYFQWMRNIEPWCVSRQLWWGHRIPAWYGPDGKIFVAEDEADAIAQAKLHYKCDVTTEPPSSLRDTSPVNGGRKVESEAFPPPLAGEVAAKPSEGGLGEPVYLYQDEDVLDTWFSSALWPFSTLGWPEEDSDIAATIPPPFTGEVAAKPSEGVGGTQEPPSALRATSPASGGRKDTSFLKKHYPTSVLVTAHDIIFFWVARMMMQGLHFMKEAPFPQVLIHGLVVDEHGQKMSKSKGNGIDPLDLIDKFGADALRFSLAAQAAQGRNVRISEPRVEGYRNFGTKLWNAARFCEMNECRPNTEFNPGAVKATLNQWIVHEANNCAADVTRELEAFRFNDAAGAIYKFTWNVFCDWYLELAKPTFMGEDEAAKAETRATTAWALDQILKLLHPFMPFISEQLWGGFAKRGDLITTAWPTHDAALTQVEAATEMNWAINLITAIRSTRMEMNVPAGAKVELVVAGGDTTVNSAVLSHKKYIQRLARVLEIKFEAEPPKGSVQIIHEGSTFALPLAGVIDIDAERARLEKGIAGARSEITGIDKKLANKNFVERAPKEVVEEQHTRRADFEIQIGKLEAALERLKGL
jgi:valyl-tRNA synthetase